jgi:hypothetical protein
MLIYAIQFTENQVKPPKYSVLFIEVETTSHDIWDVSSKNLRDAIQCNTLGGTIFLMNMLAKLQMFGYRRKC